MNIFRCNAEPVLHELTVKLELLVVIQPAELVMVINPVDAPVGTAVWTSDELITTNVAEVPLNESEVVVAIFVPIITIGSPGHPKFGVNELIIVAEGSVTVVDVVAEQPFASETVYEKVPANTVNVPVPP